MFSTLAINHQSESQYPVSVRSAGGQWSPVVTAPCPYVRCPPRRCVQCQGQDTIIMIIHNCTPMHFLSCSSAGWYSITRQQSQPPGLGSICRWLSAWNKTSGVGNGQEWGKFYLWSSLLKRARYMSTHQCLHKWVLKEELNSLSGINLKLLAILASLLY